MKRRLLICDVNGLARHTFGAAICRHCVHMLRLAIIGRGEYVVPRCGRCSLAVDSRIITPGRRADILATRQMIDIWHVNQRVLTGI